MNETDIFKLPFNGLVLKLMIRTLVEKSPFCGIKEQFMIDARNWLNDEENWKWLLDKRNGWEAK